MEEPSAGRDLRGDVTAALAACDDLVTAVEPREDVAETHGPVDDLAAIDSVLDLCLAINETKLVEHGALTQSATAAYCLATCTFSRPMSRY